MIEDIPLVVDLTDASVGVATDYTRGDGVAHFVNFTPTSVNDSTAIRPRSQGLVAVGVGEGIVGSGQSELSVFSESAIYKYIFILNLADARCFEEAEVVAWLLLESRYHTIDNLRAWLNGTHRGGIDFGSI